MMQTPRSLRAAALGLGLLALGGVANAHDRGDRHYGHPGRGWGAPEQRWDRHWDRHHDREVRVVERRYIVREAPRYYYEPMPRRVYREEPGVVIRIGLPPIVIR